MTIEELTESVEKYKKEMTLMSNNEKLSVVVELNGNYYYVDSCYTLDHGYETMVFACDANGNVTNWGDLYAEWYDNAAEMETGHNNIVANLAELI